MPLDYSTGAGAFKQNIKRELAAGKPQKQAIAIAYSVKRESARTANQGKRAGRAHRVERAGVLAKHQREHGYLR